MAEDVLFQIKVTASIRFTLCGYPLMTLTDSSMRITKRGVIVTIGSHKGAECRQPNFHFEYK